MCLSRAALPHSWAEAPQQWVETQSSQIAPSAAPLAAIPSVFATAHVANTVVLSWFNEAILAAFTADFAHYSDQQSASSNYFTPIGWVEMERRHKEMHVLDIVLQQKMVLSSVAVGPAKIVSQGVQKGVYSWLVEAPYLVELADARQKKSRKIVLRGLVVRADDKVHYRGLALDKIAVRYMPVEPQPAGQADPLASPQPSSNPPV